MKQFIGKASPIQQQELKQMNWLVLIAIFFLFSFLCLVVITSNSKKKNSSGKSIHDLEITTITFKELRSCEGFEDISEREAKLIINTYQLFSVLTYKTFSHEQEST